MSANVFAAVDLGASGGRVVAGTVDGDAVTLDVVHHFPNRPVELDGHLRWDITRLFEEIRSGLDQVPERTSIGIDTWAVDYGLLDDGKLLADPVAYRDGRTTTVIDDVHAVVPPDELFAVNGLQFLPFNTIYQLAAEQRGALWDRAANAVLLPDLLAYWLTGELRTELTNASTTGLLDVRTKQWSSDLLERLDIPSTLLPPLQPAGTVRGVTADGTTVTTVGSHDTASAVVAVPATTSRFAYIASGTWSLVGLELDRPVLSAAARAANFSNEGGVDARIRFLRNTGGLWFLQESLREWSVELMPLLAEAASLPQGGPTFDVDDPALIPPGEMPSRIADAVARTGGRPPATPAEVVRCIVDSLAAAYVTTVRTAAELAAVEVEVVHIVGGGSQNELLCQRTADALGLPVIAGPVEATALGNVLVQARASGAGASSLEAMRAGIASSVPLRRYDPS